MTRTTYTAGRQRTVGQNIDAFCWLACLSLLLLAGCTNSSASTAGKGANGENSAAAPGNDEKDGDEGAEPAEEAGDPIKAASADEVLSAMAEAYQQTGAYRDAAVLDFRFEPPSGENKEQHDFDYAVIFARPDKLRLRTATTVIVSDGDRMRATIKENEQRFDADILDIPAPAKLTLDELRKDDVLAGFLLQGMGGLPVQLVLLLAEDPLTSLLDGAKEKTLLPPEKIDGRWHHVVRVLREDGPLTFWIGQRNHLLRRLQFPTDEMQKAFAEQGATGEITLIADFRNARFEAPQEGGVYQLSVPANKKAVARFNSYKLKKRPPPPTPLLGKQVGEFTLKDLEGNEHTRDSLAGKIVVLDFWATWCPPCLLSMPRLEKVYEKYADNKQVQFLAVNIDEPAVENAQVAEQLEKAGIKIPVARADHEALKAFGVEELPNLIVLGPDGVIEDNEVGEDEVLINELAPRLKKLIAGESLHAAAQAQFDERLSEYFRRVNAPPEEAEQAGEAAVLPRDEPAELKLTKLWSTADLTEPGNILVVPGKDGPPKILVHDGWRHVVELGADGQTVSRHLLDGVPPDSVTAILRTAVNGNGKRYYLALASGQQQAFVYDEEWALVTKYPEEQGHEGVADAWITDLDNDGEVDLCVSYWGIVGVQRADLDGKRRWSYRDGMKNAYSMAVVRSASGSAWLLCANGNDDGYLVLLSDLGELVEKIVVPRQHLFKIAAADLDNDGRPELCGLAPTSSGNQTVVGFEITGGELWKQALAAGNYQSPIDALTSGRLLPGEQSHWIAAGPDGAILFIDAEGTLVDSFHYGEALHGLAAAEIDGERVLIVATGQKVEAWKVER